MEVKLITAKQVAERLGVDYTTVHYWVKQGRIKPVILTRGKKRRTLRFDPADVERFLDEAKQGNLRRICRGYLRKMGVIK